MTGTPDRASSEPMIQRGDRHHRFLSVAIREQQDGQPSRAPRPKDFETSDQSACGSLAVLVVATRQLGHQGAWINRRTAMQSPGIGDWKQALDYGDKCWSKILSNWATVRDQGLTRHENWWPAIYRQACQAWGVPPDPKVLAFAETYEGQRADLQTVSVSA